MTNMLDKFKSVALEGYIRNKFPQYLEGGDIGVELDTDAAKCSFRATLAGESQPISIEVGTKNAAKTGANNRVLLFFIVS